MRELAIIGIGIHPWGKFPEKSVHELNLEVAQMALKDANMDWTDIQALFAGQDPWAGIQGMLSGNVLAQDLGLTGIPVTNNYNACATGATVSACYAPVALHEGQIRVIHQEVSYDGTRSRHAQEGGHRG